MLRNLSDWGVELAFLRTRVGSEFKVAQHLLGSDPFRDTSFFGAYGYFDLVGISVINSLSDHTLIPFDEDILEFAPFSFFSDKGNGGQKKFFERLQNWPVAVASFIKIHPQYLVDGIMKARERLAEFLREHFSDVHVFFGLGYSEILLLSGGDNLPALCQHITDSRIAASQEEIPSSNGNPLPLSSLFSKTTTFPLTSYKNVHATERYEILAGEVSPVITVACDPEFESGILSSLPKGTSARNVYGKSDLIIYWDAGQIPFKVFASALTDLRRSWSENSLVAKTTSYIETERALPQKQSTAELSFGPRKSHPGLPPLDHILTVNPLAFRASLVDLFLRMASALSDEKIGRHYWDMLNTAEYICHAVENKIIASGVDQLAARETVLVMTEVADLCRLAINQRYAGLEYHPETLAHSQSPVLCDIRVAVSAASCLPYYIFNNLYDGRGAEKIWAGFVVFGGTYSPQWYNADIIALPQTFLFKPVEEWWKVTHEIAHAVYRVCDVRNKISADLTDYVSDLFRNTGTDYEHSVSELFANWFDWFYIFSSDTNFFLKSIWESWLTFPMVWTHTVQYLTRAFFVYLCPEMSRVIKLKGTGRRDQHLLPFLKEKWESFTSIIRQIPSGKEYIEKTTDAQVQQIWTLTDALIPVMWFFQQEFEKTCNVEGLYDRLNPPYPSLEKHIGDLRSGHVTEEQIANPCKLQLELLRLLSNGEKPTLAMEIAYIFSLEAEYLSISERLGRQE
jgi:hypothetical protein